MTTQEILRRAKKTVQELALASNQKKNRALELMAEYLLQEQDAILAANTADLEAAKGVISEVMLDRLALSPARIQGMADGILALTKLPDPVGEVISRVERPNGIVIEKTAVPMGVVASNVPIS